MRFGRVFATILVVVSVWFTEGKLPYKDDTTSNPFGQHFLLHKTRDHDIITLESGVLYKVIDHGGGLEHPHLDTQCTYHYEGRTAEKWSRLPKGIKFESTYDLGDAITGTPSDQIPGLTEAMQLMVEGDKWEIYIPSGLAYGDGGQGDDVPAGSVVVFTLELLKILGPSKAAERGAAPFVDYTNSEHFDFANKPMILAFIRKPLGGSKIFEAFRSAARHLVKEGLATADDFGMSAGAVYQNGKWTKDKLASVLKLHGPAVYADPGHGYLACPAVHHLKHTVEEMRDNIVECTTKAIQTKKMLRKAKEEL